MAWGFLLGPAGAILAIPSTLTLKKLVEVGNAELRLRRTVESEPLAKKGTIDESHLIVGFWVEQPGLQFQAAISIV